MRYNRQLHSDTKGPRVDIFLLTKPPFSERARFCLRLIAQSENAVLYLDLEARGVQAGDKTVVLFDFYERLVEDAMNKESKLYAF